MVTEMNKFHNLKLRLKLASNTQKADNRGNVLAIADNKCPLIIKSFFFGIPDIFPCLKS